MALKTSAFRLKFVSLAKIVEHPNFLKIEVHASYGRLIQFMRNGTTLSIPYALAGASVLFTEYVAGQYTYDIGKGVTSIPAHFTSLINELTTGSKKIEAPIFIGGNQLINQDNFQQFKIGCTTITHQEMRTIIKYVAPKVGLKVTQ